MRKIVCLLFSVLLFSCLVKEEDVYDKEVRLSFRFPFNGIEGFNTETSILTDNIVIKNFDKRNYPNLSSIKVSTFLRGESEIFVELYNVTDGVVVENSLMSTATSQYVWVDSENFVDNLPEKKIDLTFAIHGSDATGECGIMDAELILERY
jgi:hypothetical protein